MQNGVNEIMDDRYRIRIALIIINVALAILPIAIWYFRRNYWDVWGAYNLEHTLPYLGWAAAIFVCVNFYVFAFIYDVNRSKRLQIENQRKEEERRKQIAERELQMERERQKERERKMELIKKYEIAGRFEEAARLCDELEMWEKAGELRRMQKTSYLISTNFSMGKDGAISCTCPNCGSSQVVASKSNMVKCEHCGNNYIIPKKILDMM
jgi:ribosomal protein S27E